MGNPPPGGRYLPGYGAGRVLIDGGLTAGFDETGPLLIALAWLVGLGAVVSVLFHRNVRPAGA